MREGPPVSAKANLIIEHSVNRNMGAIGASIDAQVAGNQEVAARLIRGVHREKYGIKIIQVYDNRNGGMVFNRTDKR